MYLPRREAARPVGEARDEGQDADQANLKDEDSPAQTLVHDATPWCGLSDPLVDLTLMLALRPGSPTSAEGPPVRGPLDPAVNGPDA